MSFNGRTADFESAYTGSSPVAASNVEISYKGVAEQEAGYAKANS